MPCKGAESRLLLSCRRQQGADVLALMSSVIAADEPHFLIDQCKDLRDRRQRVLTFFLLHFACRE
jgi:hypothetical protein